MFKENKLIKRETNLIPGPRGDETPKASTSLLSELIEQKSQEERNKVRDEINTSLPKEDAEHSDNLNSPINLEVEVGNEKYRVRIYKGEAGFDGSTDVYLPGDGKTIEEAVEGKPRLLKGLQAKLRAGRKSALVIIEGRAASIDEDKGKRYEALGEAGKFSGVIDQVSATLGKDVTNINLMGHSRGGTGIDYVLGSKDMSDKIKTISCLDSTYWDPAELIKFVNNGGRLNIAFTLTPEQRAAHFGRKKVPLHKLPDTVHETVTSVMKIVKDLNLKEEPKYHWRSADGKVNIICNPEIEHGDVARRYVSPFMKAGAGAEDSGIDPLASTAKLIEQTEYSEEKIAPYLEQIEEARADSKTIDEFLKWAKQQNDPEIIRMAGVAAAADIEDDSIKHIRLSAAFLEPIKAKNGHATFKVNFKKNKPAENSIGGGHLLPFSFEAIRVYGANGRVLHNYARRGVVDGIVGYFEPGTDQYAALYDGCTVEVLGVRDMPTSLSDAGYDEYRDERELIEHEGKRRVVQGELNKFMKNKGIDAEVDALYMTNNQTELEKTLRSELPNWWKETQTGKGGDEVFEKSFLKQFGSKITFYKNISTLAGQNPMIEGMTLSRLESLYESQELELLKHRELTSQELEEFTSATELLNKNPAVEGLIVDAAKVARENEGPKPEDKVFVKGKCEQAVRTVTSRVIELAKGQKLGSNDFKIRNTQLDEQATKVLRGKAVKDLTMDDFKGLKPGLAFYVASTNKYAKRGVKITPGTNERIPVIKNTDRHWVMWDGVGFTDNWGTGRSLEDLQQKAGGDRVVVNVHDPLKEFGVLV